jgi:heme-degrading monooxygenase HmoA
MDAPFAYVVKFWVSPEGTQTILHWLDSKHTAEVVAQPGFKSVRRVRLEEKSEDGWQAYMMIYGVESRDALMRYFESDAPKQNAKEREPFAHHLRTERGWGDVDFRIG